jgi:hypothetical protein
MLSDLTKAAPQKIKVQICSAQIGRIFFINPRPACCKIEKGGEGERDIYRTVEMNYPLHA